MLLFGVRITYWNGRNLVNQEAPQSDAIVPLEHDRVAVEEGIRREQGHPVPLAVNGDGPPGKGEHRKTAEDVARFVGPGDPFIPTPYLLSNALIAAVTCGCTSFGTAIDNW